MSIMESLVVGLLKGATGVDFEAWLSNMPMAAGEALGSRLRKHLRPDNTLTEQGEVELLEALKSDPELATVAAISAVDTVANLSKSDSLLPTYVSVLNIVTHIIRETQRSIVLRGFFHSSDCLTYWDYRRRGLTPPAFPDFRQGSITKDIEFPKEPLSVYILKGSFEDDKFTLYNTAIRKSRAHCLTSAVCKDAFMVTNMGEFEIEISEIHALGNPKFHFSADKPETLEIPDGSSGMVHMIKSIDDALLVQGKPSVELARSFSEISN